MSGSRKRRLSMSSEDTEDGVESSNAPDAVVRDADDASVQRESQRLKDLAYKQGILRPADHSVPSRCLPPPPGLRLYSHTDVLKKNQSRSNPRCLFVFPGRFHLLSTHSQDIKQQQEAVKAAKAEHAAAVRADSIASTTSASLDPSLTQIGRIGSVAHMDSSNPVIYIDFPTGQMKLLGSIVYLKNSSLLAIEYHHPQSSKKIKTLTCKATFDYMFVFSEYHWIGRKEDNPTEQPLDIPIELTQQAHIAFSIDDTITGISITEPAITTEEAEEEDVVEIDRSDEEEQQTIDKTTANNSSGSIKKSNKTKSVSSPKKQRRKSSRDKDDYEDDEDEDEDADLDVDGENRADIVVSTPVSRPRRASRKEVHYDVDLEASDTEVKAEEEERHQEESEEEEDQEEEQEEEADGEEEEEEAEEDDEESPPRSVRKTSKQADNDADDDEVVLISDDDD